MVFRPVDDEVQNTFSITKLLSDLTVATTGCASHFKQTPLPITKHNK
jgi:hypothetical protein